MNMIDTFHVMLHATECRAALGLSRHDTEADIKRKLRSAPYQDVARLAAILLGDLTPTYKQFIRLARAEVRFRKS